MINIHAREITDDLTSLVSQIDELVSPALSRGGDNRTQSFVVFLTDDPDEMEPKLAKLAEEKKIKNIPLTLFDGEAGHPDYKIAKDAEVTVLMWTNLSIEQNFAFKKGELNADAVKKVVAAAKKHVGK